MGSPTRSNNSNTPFREMKLIALFAFAAIAVAHSAPEDSAVAENFVQSTPEFVVESQDDYNMSAENLLAELNGKSWKNLEAEFNQLIQNEDSDTQMATLFSFQKMAKMDPEELGQLTMDAMHKDQSAELEQMYAAPKAKSEESDMVATDAKMESRTGWHRWRPHAHIPHRWRPVRQITRAVRHVGRWAASAARAVGGVIVSAVKRLGAYLKRLAAKLCRKVLRKVVKKVHKYVSRHVTRFCIKLCIKAAGKVYLLGGGSPAQVLWLPPSAQVVRSGASSPSKHWSNSSATGTCLVPRWTSSSPTTSAIQSGSRVKNWLRSKTNPSGASSRSISRSVSRTLSRKRRNASVARRFVSITRGTSRSTLGAARSSRAGSRRGSVVACNQQQVF